MKPLTVIDYLGKYATHPDASSEIRGTAARMLDKVNAGLLLAERDGVKLHINPLTGCYIAGSGNGGFRPHDCKVGADHSGHKMGELPGDLGRRFAVDNYDPARELSAWSKANGHRLYAIGILAMEDPRWTPSWCHWQTYSVPSGHFCYVPSSAPALVAELGAEVPDLGTAVA